MTEDQLWDNPCNKPAENFDNREAEEGYQAQAEAAAEEHFEQQGIQKELQKARDMWAQMKQTKFPDEQILEMIWIAMDCPAEYASGNALTAKAMIAYNNMIDARIERAERSWRER
jgi:hypothetical protein